jgi:protein TonB
VKQIQFTTIEVTEEEVKDPPPSVEELKDQNISTETTEGEDGLLGPVEVAPTVEEKPVVEAPVTFAEQMAQYPGGEQAMLQDIYNSIVYPELEKEQQIQGTVIVSFVVEKDGSVSNVEVAREVPGGKGLSREAVKAVKSLKKFAPAKMNGNPVRLRMNLPIRFTLK